jgi:hypothetical protein
MPDILPVQHSPQTFPAISAALPIQKRPQVLIAEADGEIRTELKMLLDLYSISVLEHTTAKKRLI